MALQLFVEAKCDADQLHTEPARFYRKTQFTHLGGFLTRNKILVCLKDRRFNGFMHNSHTLFAVVVMTSPSDSVYMGMQMSRRDKEFEICVVLEYILDVTVVTEITLTFLLYHHNSHIDLRNIWHWQSCTKKGKRKCIAVNGIPSHSYGVSLAI